MKKLLILFSSVLMAGCFICHKGVQETAAEKPAQPQEPVIVRYSFPEVANFEFDSKAAQVNQEKMAALDQDIKAHPEAVIVVTGHTDNVGTEAYNKTLSVKRANAVADLLKKQGYTNPIDVKGAWYSEPIATNETEQGRAQNRRVDVMLVKGGQE